MTSVMYFQPSKYNNNNSIASDAVLLADPDEHVVLGRAVLWPELAQAHSLVAPGVRHGQAAVRVDEVHGPRALDGLGVAGVGLVRGVAHDQVVLQ